VNKNPYKQQQYLEYRAHCASIVASGVARCAMCGGGIPPRGVGDRYRVRGGASSWSVDHTIPLAVGGTNEVSNMRLVHQLCNSRGGGKLGGRMRTRKRKVERSNKFKGGYQ